MDPHREIGVAIPWSHSAFQNMLSIAATFQKNPRVRKICVRNSGAGNGCANFMDTWKKRVLSAGKTMSVKFPFFWVFFLGGGGECRFYFYGRADFSEHCAARVGRVARQNVFVVVFFWAVSHNERF